MGLFSGWSLYPYIIGDTPKAPDDLHFRTTYQEPLLLSGVEERVANPQTLGRHRRRLVTIHLMSSMHLDLLNKGSQNHPARVTGAVQEGGTSSVTSSEASEMVTDRLTLDGPCPLSWENPVRSHDFPLAHRLHGTRGSQSCQAVQLRGPAIRLAGVQSRLKH